MRYISKENVVNLINQLFSHYKINAKLNHKLIDKLITTYKNDARSYKVLEYGIACIYVFMEFGIPIGANVDALSFWSYRYDLIKMFSKLHISSVEYIKKLKIFLVSKETEEFEKQYLETFNKLETHKEFNNGLILAISLYQYLKKLEKKDYFIIEENQYGYSELVLRQYRQEINRILKSD